jgi:hypothetical protein
MMESRDMAMRRGRILDGFQVARQKEHWIQHCKENPIYIYLFWEWRGLCPNIHIHVSVSNLYIPRIGPHISLQ